MFIPLFLFNSFIHISNVNPFRNEFDEFNYLFNKRILEEEKEEKKSDYVTYLLVLQII